MAKKRKNNCFFKSGRWYFIVWVHDRRQTFKGFTDLVATQRLKADLEVQIAKHQTGLPVQPTCIAPLMHEHLVRLGLIPKILTRTLREWALAYVDDSEAGEKWTTRKRATLLKAIDELRWRTIAEIDVEQARRWIKRMTWKETISKTEHFSSKSNQRKFAQQLRSFGLWLENEGITPNNPFRRLALPKIKDHERVIVRRALSGDELQRLLDASGERALLYLTAMGTGLRAEELETLTTASFDLDRGLVRQRKTKNGKTAVIPLHPDIIGPLRAYLAGRHPESPVWTIGWKHGAARILRRDLAKAGIEYRVNGAQFDFHSLRHQFSSLLADAGIEASTRQKLTRHATLRDLQRYTHIPDAAAVEALAKVKLPTITVGGRAER